MVFNSHSYSEGERDKQEDKAREIARVQFSIYILREKEYIINNNELQLLHSIKTPGPLERTFDPGFGVFLGKQMMVKKRDREEERDT